MAAKRENEKKHEKGNNEGESRQREVGKVLFRSLTGQVAIVHTSRSSESRDASCAALYEEDFDDLDGLTE